MKEGHASSSSHSVPQGIYWGDQRRIRDVMGAIIYPLPTISTFIFSILITELSIHYLNETKKRWMVRALATGRI